MMKKTFRECELPLKEELEIIGSVCAKTSIDICIDTEFNIYLLFPFS